jgi:hypothetical protein
MWQQRQKTRQAEDDYGAKVGWSIGISLSYGKIVSSFLLLHFGNYEIRI